MRLLVIRTSALGDAALTTPVLKGMRERYPDVEVVILTRENYRPLFSGIPGLQIFCPDLEYRHKGLAGLFRLFRDLRKDGNIDHVIDLHDVLRSKILRIMFRVAGVGSSVVDKGRREKKAVIRGTRKVQLKHTVERYRDVFVKAGFAFDVPDGPSIVPTAEAVTAMRLKAGISGGLNIGVAPCARHALKMWPPENMITLLNMIREKYKVKFWLFGGFDEIGQLEEISASVADSVVVAGRYSLEEELALISTLGIMIAMDSSNMHLAALSGIKVISLWGGTDPLNGFGAWMQPGEYSVRIPTETLTCRPCTVYGKGECKRGDFACMIWLKPAIVFEKIDAVLSTI